ncbi:MAG: hypothetical protein HYT12_04765, partial [Candidatus Liptonbacteria bacterium]|nr:hypothetical protein [Candidatus Liptonbacteria bacterium]
MDRRIIDTEMVSLSLTGSSSDDMSGVATATMSIFKIGETADFNESAFAKMSCDDNQQFVPIEIVALNLTSVNPLTVTWGHDYNLTNGIFCAEVHATDNAGNTENTATAGPIAYTYTAPTPPPPPPTPPPTPPPSTSGDSGSSGGQGGSINPGVGSPQPAYGAILGATSGQVLGESTACSTEYLRDYIKLGKKNDPEQVAKLQEFLNSYENAG